MIKKSVFEDELIAGMQKELTKTAAIEASEQLSAAVDYLNSAVDIFTDAGMHTQADGILKILVKIANKPEVNVSLDKLMEHGLTTKDLSKIKHGDHRSLAKLNLVMRRAGYTEDEMKSFLGDKFLSLDTAERWYKNNPMGQFKGQTKDLLNPIEPGDEISMQSLKDKEKPSEDELVFESLLSDDDNQDARIKHRKPKNPLTVSDRHTKGLTDDKMIQNLLHHGTVFNLASDQNDVLNVEIGDDLEADDNTDFIGDFEDEIK